MENFINFCIRIQLYVSLFLCCASFVLLPFVPCFGVHVIYRKWGRFCSYKWVRVLLLSFMSVLAILGFIMLFSEFSYRIDDFQMFFKALIRIYS